MTPILSTIFFTLGIIIGSFLNVIIARFNTGRSLGGRSACMSCQTKIKWYDLVPLFSFLTLQGRCRTCQTRISWTYPLVEVITGLIFLSLFLKFSTFGGSTIGGPGIFTLQFILTYAYYAFVFSLLVIISVYDLRHKIIPDILSFIFGLVALAGTFMFVGGEFGIFSFHTPSIFQFLSPFLVASPFAFFWFISNGAWMGFGDAKLALGIGWLLGISSAFSAVVIAFWAGALIGICLIIFSKKYGMKSEIPFAVYLALGVFLVFIFNLNLFSTWYF